MTSFSERRHYEGSIYCIYYCIYVRGCTSIYCIYYCIYV